jgi:hypothetical protein
MSAKKKIDKAHPLYAKYVAKCEILFRSYSPKIEAERAKYPEWQGLDHPSYAAVRLLERECNAKLKALQKEFDFLFSD